MNNISEKIIKSGVLMGLPTHDILTKFSKLKSPTGRFEPHEILDLIYWALGGGIMGLIIGSSERQTELGGALGVVMGTVAGIVKLSID